MSSLVAASALVILNLGLPVAPLPLLVATLYCFQIAHNNKRIADADKDLNAEDLCMSVVIRLNPSLTFRSRPFLRGLLFRAKVYPFPHRTQRFAEEPGAHVEKLFRREDGATDVLRDGVPESLRLRKAESCFAVLIRAQLYCDLETRCEKVTDCVN